MAGDGLRVSVLTAVYNGERYLAAAIDSILAQTFTDFEYILVDDASTDYSPQILRHYSDLDARVQVWRNPTNLNISGTLNRALALARGEYFAVLDQDDLALPRRLEQQVAFLDTNPEIGVVGTQATAIDEEGRALYPMVFPENAVLARWTILFNSPALHSAAMFRRSLVLAVGSYPVAQWHLNDYILFAALQRSTGIANLPETLVLYRRHPQQTVSVNTKRQQAQAWLLTHSLLAERLNLRVGVDDIGILYNGVRGERLADAAALLRAADLLAVLLDRFLLVEEPDQLTGEQIRADCARRLLTIAWVHRRSCRDASRVLLSRALTVDPHLWQRPRTWTLLRWLGR